MTLSHTCSALSNPLDMSGIADAAAADIRREVLERFAAAGAACDFARLRCWFSIPLPRRGGRCCGT